MTDCYGIQRLYRARLDNKPHDDTRLRDQHQLEVYLHALGLMKKHGMRTVVDLGCGSAYKLMTYLSDYDTVGLELPPTVEHLRQQYPDRSWNVCDFNRPTDIDADVLICADVIEHLADPDELMRFITSCTYRFLVISTPDRSLLYRPWQRGYYGPPRNRAHVREWTFREFRRYLSPHVRILIHRITNLAQHTQMAICTPLDSDATWDG